MGRAGRNASKLVTCGTRIWAAQLLHRAEDRRRVKSLFSTYLRPHVYSEGERIGSPRRFREERRESWAEDAASVTK